jgi:hypothetical protein
MNIYDLNPIGVNISIYNSKYYQLDQFKSSSLSNQYFPIRIGINFAFDSNKLSEQDQIKTLEHLNTSLSFECSSQRIKHLLKQIDRVLIGEKIYHLFPREDIPYSVKITKDEATGGGVEGIYDSCSIPTLDFKKILELYLDELIKFENSHDCPILNSEPDWYEEKGLTDTK